MAKVLLLEDDLRFARAAQQVLRGHEVVHVATVEDAIDALQGCSFDCALIDLNLTDFDDYSGREVLSYLLHNQNDLPRAVVTGSPLEGSIVRNIILRYGVADIVIKGDVGRDGRGTRDLVDTVNELLAGSESRRRETARSEVERVAKTGIEELSRRIEALQDFADQVGRGRFHRDPTAARRAELQRGIVAIEAERDVLFGNCDSIALTELPEKISNYERDVRQRINDSAT